MSYTLNTVSGDIIRDIDNVVVNNKDDANDPDFLLYQEWARAGNMYALYTPPNNRPKIELYPNQFKKALLHKGMKAMVEAALELPGNEDLAIDYEYSLSFHSDNPSIIYMTNQLALANNLEWLTEQWLYENIFVYGSGLN